MPTLLNGNLKEKRIDVLNLAQKYKIDKRLKHFPKELSGGEQQRVAIARAIVNNPKLLICDEPTGNLDPIMSEEIVGVLDNINKSMDTTVIMATHDRDMVNKFKKRVVVLNGGRLVKDIEEGKYDNEAVKNV